MKEHTLYCENISKTFDGIVALKNVNLKVKAGAIHGIIGPNGAGKTTLFNVLAGTLKPDSGSSITFRGHKITGLKPNQITELGIARTFQKLRIFHEMTVLENVMIGRHCRSRGGIPSVICRVPFKKSNEEREIQLAALGYLSFTGLYDKRDIKAGILPYGVQRKVELARALATGPGLLLLDEPVAGMNPAETGEIISLLKKINESGITIILIEHKMDFIMSISEVISVLNFGNLVCEGTPAYVRESPQVIEAYLGKEGDQ